MASGKILVVDDDRNICELLRLYIEKEGFDVVIANDGRQALDLFDSEKPDLIMLDIMLPELDGWQVCREIRKKSQCPVWSWARMITWSSRLKLKRSWPGSKLFCGASGKTATIW